MINTSIAFTGIQQHNEISGSKDHLETGMTPPGEKQIGENARDSARIQFRGPKRRVRLIVRRGIENISMPLNMIALFYSENKIVYAVDQHGKKYMADYNLSALEYELDDSIFFRANRQFIVNINHIKSFKSYERVKLKLDMHPGILNDQSSIIISQETAPEFRKWIYSA